MITTVADVARGKLVEMSGVYGSRAFLLVELLDVGAVNAVLVDSPKCVTGAKIPNGGSGAVREKYLDVGVNTGAAAVGDPVYAALSGSAGDWQLAVPAGSPTKGGIVVKADATTGVVLLAPQARVGAA